MDYFNKNIWESWVNKSFEYFSQLNDGAKIAFMLPNTDNLIILNKNDSKMNFVIDDKESFKFPFAEIGFKFDEGVIDEILNNDFNSFLKFLKKDQISLLSFVSEDELVNKGYSNFLNNLGFKIKNSCGCGCC